MIQNALIVLAHILAVGTTAAATSGPTIPVTIRECSSQQLSKTLFPSFATFLSSQPNTIVPPSMGIVTYQYNVTSSPSSSSSPSDITPPTCLEVHIQNWSCDRELSINGAGLANAVQSIADQCQGRKYASGETAGPTGFGYYRDLETKEEFGKRLWVNTGTCGMRPRRSACTPGV